MILASNPWHPTSPPVDVDVVVTMTDAPPTMRLRSSCSARCWRRQAAYSAFSASTLPFGSPRGSAAPGSAPEARARSTRPSTWATRALSRSTAAGTDWSATGRRSSATMSICPALARWPAGGGPPTLRSVTASDSATPCRVAAKCEQIDSYTASKSSSHAVAVRDVNRTRPTGGVPRTWSILEAMARVLPIPGGAVTSCTSHVSEKSPRRTKATACHWNTSSWP